MIHNILMVHLQVNTHWSLVYCMWSIFNTRSPLQCYSHSLHSSAIHTPLVLTPWYIARQPFMEASDSITIDVSLCIMGEQLFCVSSMLHYVDSFHGSSEFTVVFHLYLINCIFISVGEHDSVVVPQRLATSFPNSWEKTFRPTAWLWRTSDTSNWIPDIFAGVKEMVIVLVFTVKSRKFIVWIVLMSPN